MSDLMWSPYRFAEIPFAEIDHLGQRTLLYNDLFTVSWLLGRYCNFRCSYCWPYARSDKKDHRPFDVIVGTMDEIKRQARERGFNSFHFSFSGGEPSLHPNYLEILQHYSQDSQSNYQSCHMTTNLSQPMSWYGKYAEATKTLHRVSITASWHRQFSKKELFRDKLIFLQQQNIQTTINMVMVPENFSLLWDEALFFHEAGLNVTLKPQSNSSATEVVDGYSEEQLRLLHEGFPQRDYTTYRLQQENIVSSRPKRKLQTSAPVVAEKTAVPAIMQMELHDKQGNPWYLDQAERLNAFSFNQFRGWECSSGYRSIIIREPDGAIKRSYSCSDKPLGYIETGFKLFDQVQLCQTNSCVSSADSKIPKRKAGCTRPLWKKSDE